MNRIGYIGGSDASVILGINPWKSRLELYLEKTGQLFNQKLTDAMYWGRQLEDVIAKEYQKLNDVIVMPYPDLIKSKIHSFMAAHIDRLVKSQTETYILECKTAKSPEGWGDIGTDIIPEHYYAQVQHYLAVTGYTRCDVAVLIAGFDYRQYKITANKNYIDNLIEAEKLFWRHIENKVPPSPVILSDMNYIDELPNTHIIADSLIISMLNNYKSLKDESRHIEQKAENLKLEILKVFGNASTIIDTNNNQLATWKTQHKSSFDSTKFKNEHPDIANQYEKISKFRVLRLKEDI